MRCEWTIIPPAPSGLRIGLLGGSFNPAHPGHRHISLLALRRLALDQIWWLVTPGNPLKDHKNLPPLGVRAAAAAKIAGHPAIRITGFEAGLKSRFTADTLGLLRECFPGAHFVWVMGADNFACFHHWRAWRRIARLMPVGVINRPGAAEQALSSPAAHALQPYRLREAAARSLALRAPPAWVFLHGPQSLLSSTALRAADNLD